ncbi:MAG TPA: glutamine amidotransferase [Rhodanobacteraceae bacterium]|jgi:GMP synthase (glutamine-hydrolysing)|nr:glutamine amidotransferase [Rhodanobacteraceae bacterium]
MRPLLLIQTGEAPESIHARFGGFADWFRNAMRVEPAQLRVVRADEGAVLPAPDSVAGAVITGSAAMVTERADWSERTAAWIRNAFDADTPLFGVCYGHQLMAHALGGTVGWLPAGREMGTRAITGRAGAGGDWLDVLPATFPAHATHRQSVLEPPPDAEVLASSDLDPHQMLRYAPHAVSTQFHPEFTVAAMRAYIDARADALREEGIDPDELRVAVRETTAARALLERFALTALSRRHDEEQALL